MTMKRSLLILLLLTGLLPTSQAGISVIGILARTATVEPGDAFDGVIFIKNNGTQSSDVRLFQTDYRSQSDGSNDYGEPGQALRSNADWITVSPTRLKLAPGETQPVRYQGRTPADGKLQGTYWSMIMIEPNAAPAITPDGKPETVAVGLQTTIRFAVQIVTEVGPGGRRNSNSSSNRAQRRRSRAIIIP